LSQKTYSVKILAVLFVVGLIIGGGAGWYGGYQGGYGAGQSQGYEAGKAAAAAWTWTKPVKLIITAGPVGGVWYSHAAFVAELIRETLPGSTLTVTTGGGVANPPRVSEGTADIGFTAGNIARNAQLGVEEFDKKYENVYALCSFGPMFIYFVFVNPKVTINSLAELKEKKLPLRIGTTTKMSLPEPAFRSTLKQYGVTYDDINSWGGKVQFGSFAEHEVWITDETVDMVATSMMPGILRALETRGWKHIPVPENIVDAVIKEDPGYFKAKLLKDQFFWVKEDIPVLGHANLLIVRGDLPKELVYTLTKTIVLNAVRIDPFVLAQTGGMIHFDPSQAWKNTGILLHPGAEQAYKDLGLMPR